MDDPTGQRRALLVAAQGQQQRERHEQPEHHQCRRILQQPECLAADQCSDFVESRHHV